MLENNTARNNLKDAASVDEVICLSVLISQGELPYNATIQNSENYFCEQSHGCSSCKYRDNCLAVIINE
jgi:hypothetical protein